MKNEEFAAANTNWTNKANNSYKNLKTTGGSKFFIS